MANFRALLNHGLQAVKKSVQRLGKSGDVLMITLCMFISIERVGKLSVSSVHKKN